MCYTVTTYVQSNLVLRMLLVDTRDCTLATTMQTTHNGVFTNE